MAKNSAIYVRLYPDLKEKAEAILKQLGITPSQAVIMLYSQIVLRGKLPFKIDFNFSEKMKKLENKEVYYDTNSKSREIVSEKLAEYFVDKYEFDTKSKTDSIFVRMDFELKENTEKILSKLNISPTTVVEMLYSQIITFRAIPFDISIPPGRPKSIHDFTEEDLLKSLEESDRDYEKGFYYTLEEINEILDVKYGF